MVRGGSVRELGGSRALLRLLREGGGGGLWAGVTRPVTATIIFPEFDA
jgi:hypothetical protein